VLYLTIQTRRTNILSSAYRVRKSRSEVHLSKSCDDIFDKLIQGGVPPEELYDTVCKQVLLEATENIFRMARSSLTDI
jgi:phosphoenolpyruvate carboxylase